MNNNDDKTPSQEELARGAKFARGQHKEPTTPATPSQQNLAYLSANLTPIEYDVPLIESFLDVVFHDGLDEGEYICCYFDAKYQGFPLEEQAFYDKLESTKQPAKLYMGTGTVHKDPQKKRIFNRNALFTSYRVLVLDDIGTKVSVDKIPEDFKPTYIIESSPNNFQYGYVLAEPIKDFEQARALVEMVYGSGCTDSGGKLVMKKVRLPEGINGKKGKEHEEFRVNLHHMDGPLWTPEDILKTLGVGTDWANVVEDAAAARKRNTRVVGTSLWSPLRAHNASLEGVIDPVLEWLVDNDMVVNFDHDWAEIVCPWGTDHTTGSTSGYYSPVGYGDGEHASMRTFNCFHDSCSINKTDAFLTHVGANGGPLCAQFDPAAALVASHVYDATNNTIWGIKGLFPRVYKGVDGFKNTHNQTVRKPTLDNKNAVVFKNMPISTLFMHSPARVVVDGTTFDPRTTARIIKEGDQLKLNTFSPPAWGEGRFDHEVIKPFIDYLEYLIPAEEERALFIEWLAAKVQNMGFRGWGIMMVAKDQGTGRGTLAKMLTRLFDERNCTDQSFAELLNPKDSFNEWQSKLLVVSNEASDTSNTKTFYNQCAQLRELIDTTPKLVTINNKYGAKETRMLCTSHLIFTNYENGAALEDNDRRMFVIQNAHHPAEAEYFTQVNEWADKTDSEGNFVFVNHLARWLKTLPVDLTKMNGRAPSTQAKDDMVEASKSAMDLFMSTFITALPSPYSHVGMVKTLVMKFYGRLGEPSDTLVRNLYRQLTDSTHQNNTFKHEGKNVRVRTSHKHPYSDEMENIAQLRIKQVTLKTTKGAKARRSVVTSLNETNLNHIAQVIEQKLDEAGY